MTGQSIEKKYKEVDLRYSKQIHQDQYVLDLIDKVRENIELVQRNQALDDYSDILLDNLMREHFRLQIEEEEYIQEALDEVRGKRTINQRLREALRNAIDFFEQKKGSKNEKRQKLASLEM